MGREESLPLQPREARRLPGPDLGKPVHRAREDLDGVGYVDGLPSMPPGAPPAHAVAAEEPASGPQTESQEVPREVLAKRQDRRGPRVHNPRGVDLRVGADRETRLACREAGGLWHGFLGRTRTSRSPSGTGPKVLGRGRAPRLSSENPAREGRAGCDWPTTRLQREREKGEDGDPDQRSREASHDPNGLRTRSPPRSAGGPGVPPAGKNASGSPHHAQREGRGKSRGESHYDRRIGGDGGRAARHQEVVQQHDRDDTTCARQVEPCLGEKLPSPHWLAVERA